MSSKKKPMPNRKRTTEPRSSDEDSDEDQQSPKQSKNNDPENLTDISLNINTLLQNTINTPGTYTQFTQESLTMNKQSAFCFGGPVSAKNMLEYMLQQDEVMNALAGDDGKLSREKFGQNTREQQMQLFLTWTDDQITSYFAFEEVLDIAQKAVDITDDNVRKAYWDQVMNENVVAVRKARAEKAIIRMGWQDLMEARKPQPEVQPSAPATIDSDLLADVVATSVQSMLEPLITRELENLSKVIESKLTKVIEDRIKSGLKKRKREDDDDSRAALPNAKKLQISNVASSLINQMMTKATDTSTASHQASGAARERERPRNEVRTVNLLDQDRSTKQDHLNTKDPDSSVQVEPTKLPTSKAKSKKSELTPSTGIIMTKEKTLQGRQLYAELATRDNLGRLKEIIELQDVLLKLMYGGNNAYFNPSHFAPAKKDNHPDTAKTVIKNVRDVLVPCTETIWKEKVEEAYAQHRTTIDPWSTTFKNPKWCLICNENEKMPFPCFKTIESEKKKRYDNWHHFIVEGLLSNYKDYNFTVSSLTELFPHHYVLTSHKQDGFCKVCSKDFSNSNGNVTKELREKHLTSGMHGFMLRYAATNGADVFKLKEIIAGLKNEIKSWKDTLAASKKKDGSDKFKDAANAPNIDFQLDDEDNSSKHKKSKHQRPPTPTVRNPDDIMEDLNEELNDDEESGDEYDDE